MGVLLGSMSWQLAGIILFIHSALDRVYGLGLKYADSFQNTHLGRVGRGKPYRKVTIIDLDRRIICIASLIKIKPSGKNDRCS